MLVIPFVFLTGVALALMAWARARRTGALAQIAAGLAEGYVEPNESGVIGTARGVTITFRFITKGSGSGAESWTEVVALGPFAEIDLELRPSGVLESWQVARGDAVDVEVGDPAFDKAFVVEGAPAAAVKKLLDAPLRKDLLALAPLVAKTNERGAVVEKRGWIEDVSKARVLIDIAAAIATRAPAAVAEMVSESVVTDSSAYRGTVSSDGGRAAIDAARDEVVQLRSMRRARAARRGKIIAAVVVAFGVFWVLCVILGK